MIRQPNNKALWFILPALSVLAFSFAVPVMAVINYSIHDVFSGNNFVWAGTY